MGTRYTTTPAIAFNSSPPVDDGSQVASNLVTWAGVKTKLADPVHTQADSIDSKLVSALDLSARAISGNDTAIASDHWKTLQVTGATTITLSSAASMGAGYEVGVFNAGASTVTVAPGVPADTINNVSASVTIPIKGTMIFRTNQALTGYNVVGQSNRIDAGTINGASIGATTPSSGVFTTLTVGTGTAGLGTITKRKTADESVSNAGTGTTLQDDDHLTFSIAATEEWVANIFLDAGAVLSTTGIKVAITVPAAATLNVGAMMMGTSLGAAASFHTTTSGAALDGSVGVFATCTNGVVQLNVWVLNGANAGSVTLQFAQSSASATSLTVRKGSFLQATRIA